MIRLSEEQGSWLEAHLRSVEGAESRLLADQILDQLAGKGSSTQVIDKIYSLLSYGKGRNHITRDVVDGLRRAILSPSELRRFEATLKDRFACSTCGREIQAGESVTYVPNGKEQNVQCVLCVSPSLVPCAKCQKPRDIVQAFKRLTGRVKLTCDCKEKSLTDLLKEKKEAEANVPVDPFSQQGGRVFQDPETGQFRVVGGNATSTTGAGASARSAGLASPAPPSGQWIPPGPRARPFSAAEIDEMTEQQARNVLRIPDRDRGIRAVPPPTPRRNSPWESIRLQTEAEQRAIQEDLTRQLQVTREQIMREEQLRAMTQPPPTSGAEVTQTVTTTATTGNIFIPNTAAGGD